MNSKQYDIAIVGAGPVGSVCALAHAKKGARVALFEANPKASKRLAGEWLHPPALRTLREVGIEPDSNFESVAGNGFAVFPEDGSEPIVLPYADGSHGLVCEHSTLISHLHEAVTHDSNIDFYVPARVRAVEKGQVAVSHNGTESILNATRIVGADGRASVVRKSLGLPTSRTVCSRMVGVVVEGEDLPLEGYGHVLLGGPGPILMYQLGEKRVRVIVDVPLKFWIPRDRVNLLSESYQDLLPEFLRPGFIEALQNGNFYAATNELRPRITNGNSELVLVGDAAGNYHPLTAVGMTLGFGDAFDLAEGRNFREFTNKRFLATRGPELLAMGLYEVFADHRLEAVELRHSIYRNWRTNSMARNRTMNLLACENTSVIHLSLAFSATVAQTVVRQIPKSLDRFAWHRMYDVARATTVRLSWLVRGVLAQRKDRKGGGEKDNRALRSLSRAFLISIFPSLDDTQSIPNKVELPDAGLASKRATAQLLNLQDENGGWEGEMVWCPMLTAQYALLHHIAGQPLNPDQRRLILRNFEQTQLDGSCWGLHKHSPPHLFVTTLVYVACRLLGIEKDDPLVEPARRFLQAEGVLGIPSWGKFWLAMLNLYDWRGLHAILPELWSLPNWVVLHPSNWYCHTRLIYMAMATIYSNRYQAPVTPTIASLREELFPEGFDQVDFSKSRNRLRDADLFARPSVWLRSGYRITRLYERFHLKHHRVRCVNELVQRIKWELQTTSHTSISPVSGLLNILAIWLHDPNDPDLHQALKQLEGWIWEDENNGTRVTGARSASWDTAFALQALAGIDDLDGVGDALKRGSSFLSQQQVGFSFEGFREAYRNDPKGGWCFAGDWHGWPVSDCTAEAVLGIIATQGKSADVNALDDAIQFMLRAQNRDGGFGSYEARRSAVGLEWLNPSEMFGESMTEHSFVECTASCLAALAGCKEHFPQITDQTVMNSISKAEAWLRKNQASDGSWRGVWGVQYIYGTLFGVRGLLAAGANPGDPALRLACRWLLDRQCEDGGWGEHYSGSVAGKYVAHEESQIIQTAWALIALLEAGDPNWYAISNGVRYLVNTQNANGTWPEQDMAGVFFRTALLDYVLYRQYFPLHALVLYQQRCRTRQSVSSSVPRTSATDCGKEVCKPDSYSVEPEGLL